MSLETLAKIAKENIVIAPDIYSQFNIKRGLRNRNGTGVKVGLTKVGYVKGYTLDGTIKKPLRGQLSYRGLQLDDIVTGFQNEGRHGFEEVAFLLLFGKLPRPKDLSIFKGLLDDLRRLPPGFTENMILKSPSKDIMNNLQRSILALYSYDPRPDDLDLENLLSQSMSLIARMPTIMAYGYQAKAHYFCGQSLYIHAPKRGLSTAENILHMIRKDNRYSKMEADILDLCLVVHAEHGGGNNSAFTTHVVSSSGTDTYSAMAAAVGALKGPKHGGANIRVRQMVEAIKRDCQWQNPQALKAYLKNIITHKGLIYGMGHAVYTQSDPRALILKKKAYDLALEKDALLTFKLYENIEALTQMIFKELKGESFEICANVDLYSGFVYDMLNIPKALYTPLFAAARMPGWCAHRMEQIVSDKKILRPAYAIVDMNKTYTPLKDRGEKSGRREN